MTEYILLSLDRIYHSTEYTIVTLQNVLLFDRIYHSTEYTIITLQNILLSLYRMNHSI